MLKLVKLWQLLRAETLDEGALAPLLAESAAGDEGRPTDRKRAVTDLLSRAARYPSPEIRRPAAVLLRGAAGYRARAALADALRDTDPGVRLAAARACQEEMGVVGTVVEQLSQPLVQPDILLAASPHPEVRGLALLELRAHAGDTRITEALERDETARRAAADALTRGLGASRFWREEGDERLAGALEYAAPEDFARLVRRGLESARGDGARGLCASLRNARAKDSSAEACALAIASQDDDGAAVREAVLGCGSRALEDPRRRGTLSSTEYSVLETAFRDTPWQSALANAYLRHIEAHANELRRKLVTVPLEDLLLTAFEAGPVGTPLLVALAENADEAGRALGRRSIGHRATCRLLDALFEPPGMDDIPDSESRVAFQVAGAELIHVLLPGTPLFEAATRFRSGLPCVAATKIGAARAEPVEVSGSGRSFTELLRAAIAAGTDEALLESACFHPLLASEAAGHLASLGATGALFRALCAEPPPPVPEPICEALVRIDSRKTLDTVRDVVAREELDGHRRFLLARGLVERGEKVSPETFLRAAKEGSRSMKGGWLQPDDRDFLYGLRVRRADVADALIASPDGPTRRLGLEPLLRGGKHGVETLAILRRFVEEADADEDWDSAIAASRVLLSAGDATGIPFLLEETRALYVRRRRVPVAEQILRVAAPDEASAAGAALGSCPPHLARWLEAFPGPAAAGNRNAFLRGALRECEDTELATGLLRSVELVPGGDPTLERLATCFAWGVRKARALTGLEMSIHLAPEGVLGRTSLRSNRIDVSPMPILRPEPDDQTRLAALDPAGEPYGDVLVKALVLHEIGHHLHDADPESLSTAREAEREGLGRLLNLVADVFLERSMRREDPAHGKAFDLLTAWAFQRARCEVPVDLLFEKLGDHTLEVLTGVPLGRARERRSVRVGGGHLLLKLERAGHSFARFLRALRMGLGDRHGDSKVRAGLALFEKAGFRRSTPMQRLAIARRLAEIFGREATGLLGEWGPPFGGTPESELRAAAGPISDAVVQAAVARKLAARAAASPIRSTRESRELSSWWANLDPSEQFDRLGRVVKVARDPEREREAARTVRPFARRLRKELEELDLGARTEPARRRLRGRVGRAGLPAAIVRGDPRLLDSRVRKPARDLFLGLLVDCSGSMAAEKGIEKARLFAALLGEAARGLAGVETRIVGFDDSTLFDAGAAERSAAQSLAAGRGNNDAGALWHLGVQALASRRSARAIVMVSDGIPTDCSVAALEAVVRALEERSIACAQVAVRPLEFVKFRNYTLLETLDPEAAARGFAGVLSRVVRHALSGGRR